MEYRSATDYSVADFFVNRYQKRYFVKTARKCYVPFSLDAGIGCGENADAFFI